MIIDVEDTPHCVEFEIPIALTLGVSFLLELTLLRDFNKSSWDSALGSNSDFDARIPARSHEASEVLRLGILAFAYDENDPSRIEFPRPAPRSPLTTAVMIRHFASLAVKSEFTKERDSSIAALEITALEVFRLSGLIIGQGVEHRRAFTVLLG